MTAGLRFYVLLIVLVLLIGGFFNIGFAHYAGVPGVELGFVTGFFHGWIASVAFIYHVLFDQTVTIYAHQATSGWYDFGFVLGIGALLGGIFGNNDNE